MLFLFLVIACGVFKDNLVTDKIQLSHSGQYDILGFESIISICWINSKKKYIYI